MRRTVFAFASLVAFAAPPAVAQEGTAAGAATGAATGAIVGGPVGAAAGAAVGGTAGAAADANRNRDTVVVQPGTTTNERTTTCVQGANSSTCTETNVRR